MEIARKKREIRQEIRRRWSGQNPVQHQRDSQAACAQLRKQSLWQTARRVLFYAPTPEELDVWPLLLGALAEGRTVCLPRYDPADRLYHAAEIRDPVRDLRLGLMGIQEPAEHCESCITNHLDLFLVPGVAFGLNGERLGRGRGFFDRFLKSVPGVKCGVGFDFQVRDDIPMEPHDVYLNCILTPTRWWVANRPLD